MISNCRSENVVIPPGSTIGIFGSGQLGKMTAIAAKQLGYRVHVYSPSVDSPAGQVADLEVQASYDDQDSVERFAKHVDVITLEFENIPVGTIRAASKYAPVHPSDHVLETAQNRIREKSVLTAAGLPVAKSQPIYSLEDLRCACRDLPGVLKTANGGYDGKGQVTIKHPSEVEFAWRQLDTNEAVLEEVVDFEFEISVVAARNQNGMVVCYEPFKNLHRNHILDVSMSPAGLEPGLAGNAKKMASAVLDELQAIGVICIEFFVTREGQLLINEIAPRTHNSGHLTIDSHLTSQFEQQVRAICGLSLGSTQQIKPAAMVNLLGDCWGHGEPKWDLALETPNVKLHLYGKGVPEPGRKMGHLTVLAESSQQAAKDAIAARSLLESQAVPANGLGQNSRSARMRSERK